MKKTLLSILAVLAVATSARADLASDYNLSTDAAFKKRVTMAILRAAGDIRNQTDNLPSNHASRLAWARSVRDIGVAEQTAGWMAPVIVASDGDVRYAYTQDTPQLNDDDQSDVGDASIINGVNALIDDYAEEQFPE